MRMNGESRKATGMSGEGSIMRSEQRLPKGHSTSALATLRDGDKSVTTAAGAFGYFGSKQRLATRILKYMPPHNCWVELFGGALSMTMSKKPASIEIVNDLDDNIVNALRTDEGQR